MTTNVDHAYLARVRAELNAQECERFAATAPSPRAREIFLASAAKWRKGASS